MTTSAVLAACCVAFFGPLPLLLARARWPARAPRAAVVLWQAIGLAGCLAAIGSGLAVATSPLHTDLVTGVARMVGRALDGHPLAGLDLYEALGLTMACDVAFVLACGVVVTAGRTLRGRARHRRVLDLVGAEREGVLGALVLDHPQPVAYCLPGLRPRIVLSAGALDALAPPEVDAVVAHERGHTHARHDLVLLPFNSMAELLRWVPYVRVAPRAVAVLLEMAADDFAGRVHGRRTVASALVHLAGAGAGAGAVPACAFAATQAAVVLRVRRLLGEAGNSRVAALVAAAAALTALVVPLATAAAPALLR